MCARTTISSANICSARKFQTNGGRFKNSAIILKAGTHPEKRSRDLLREVVLILFCDRTTHFRQKKNLVVKTKVWSLRLVTRILNCLGELKGKLLGNCSFVCPLLWNIRWTSGSCGQSPRAITTRELFQGQVPSDMSLHFGRQLRFWRKDCFLKNCNE